MMQWQPQAVEVNLPEGGLRVGATTRVIVQEFGRRLSVETVVLALEPNARIAYHMISPMWSGDIEYVLTEKHGSTGVSMLFVPDRPKVTGATRLIIRTLAVLTRPLMQWRLRSLLGSLRRVVESKR